MSMMEFTMSEPNHQEQPGTDSPQTETQALLQLLAMSNREIELGHYQDADSFFAEMDAEDSHSNHDVSHNLDLPR